VRIETENGHTYELSDSAYQGLKESKTPREANNVFEQFAPHVPREDRWQVRYSI
jgi:hypothetical protein